MKFNPQPKAIQLSVLFYLARQNLLSKKLRTGLTLAGVVIGIGAIFFLVSFGLGLQKIVTDEIIGNQSIKSIDVASPNSAIIKLDQAAVSKMSQLPGVTQAGQAFLFPGILELRGSEIDAVTYGTDVDFQEISNLTLSAGRLLNAEDNRQAVINQSVLEAAGIEGGEDIIGQQIRLTVPLSSGSAEEATAIEDDFEVVGVIASGAGSEIFLPAHIFEAAGAQNYDQVKLVVVDSERVASVREQIESLGYETQSPIDTVDQINQIFSYFNLILVGFGVIGMIVAVLGMFNTLTISLLERTKEIGLMLTLGARQADMKRLFILEAVLLSLIGAVIGISGAILNGLIINTIMNNFARNRGVNEVFSLFSYPLWLIVGAIVFMVLVGLGVVFFPARRTQKITPINALRRE